MPSGAGSEPQENRPSCNDCSGRCSLELDLFVTFRETPIMERSPRTERRAALRTHGRLTRTPSISHPKSLFFGLRAANSSNLARKLRLGGEPLLQSDETQSQPRRIHLTQASGSSIDHKTCPLASSASRVSPCCAVPAISPITRSKRRLTATQTQRPFHPRDPSRHHTGPVVSL
jgi:hypothetical protein